ncbi:MAG: type II secretion system F family protein [Candidatus Pacebacteria bacterium]|nr:type II secretion system F family protein [Candidatus Paceibacterota bacterium]MDR3582966.1 type II secretion system F family protein [Candidatus Paceibacterota bacterium]
MKVFYSAKSFSGETKSGEMEIKDERDLAMQLRADGYILTSFKELKSNKEKTGRIKFMNRFIRISLTDKLMFTRNLSVMVSSGLPLSKALKNIALQTKKKKFASILNKVYDEIQAGNSLADGLKEYPGIFNDLFVNMIRVGEASGNLDEVLDILAIQLEKEHDLISKIKGALTYPAVILVAMFGIGIIMLTYVLPKILGVFAGMNVELPESTKVVIAISDFLRFHSILAISLFVGVIVFLKFYFMTESGKKTLGFLAINTPLVSNMVIKINCARFARIYSSLLKSGVSVVESLRIISDTLNNYYYHNAFLDGMDKVQKGIPLSDVIAKNTKIFPVLVSQMIQVGEETGKTDMVLLKLAEFYEAEVDQLSKNMSSIIEPVLMIVIGSAVGFFAVSMLEPMYSIMNQIQ